MLDKCNNTRNPGEYEGMLNGDEQLVKDLVMAAKAASQAIKQLRGS